MQTIINTHTHTYFFFFFVSTGRGEGLLGLRSQESNTTPHAQVQLRKAKEVHHLCCTSPIILICTFFWSCDSKSHPRGTPFLKRMEPLPFVLASRCLLVCTCHPGFETMALIFFFFGLETMALIEWWLKMNEPFGPKTFFK